MSTDPNGGSDAAEAPSDLSPGFLVGGGRYTLLRQIARGGMGVVWLAHDERLNEQVALKFLPPVVRNDPTELARLRQETQKSRKLTHPNIIRIYDLFESPGEPAFISMEYVNGPDLWEWMTQQPDGVLAWIDLKPLVKQLCDALAYAHGERVIHRDLKPTNLMLAENQRLKLADFGLAAVALPMRAGKVERHFGGGTLTHMSPQQLKGEAAAVTDDIYSLGATLYDLLSGRPPFYEGDIVRQLRHDDPQPLQERLATRQAPNDVPPEVAAMIMACLAKDPSNRPQSAVVVAEWIGLTNEESRAVPSLASSVSSSAATTLPEQPPQKRGNWLGLGVVGGLVCLGAVLWLNWPSRPPASPILSSASPVAKNLSPSPSPPTNPIVEPSPPIENDISTPSSAPAPAPVVTTPGNAHSLATSAVVSASAPTTRDPYLSAVLALHPQAFWRLDEADGSTAFDVTHRFDGVYNNVALGQPGRDFMTGRKTGASKVAAGFGPANGAESLVSIADIDLSVPRGGNGKFAVAAWVLASDSNPHGAGVICKGAGKGDEQFCIDCGGPGNVFRFFFRDTGGGSCWTTSAVAPDNQWHFLTGVCDQAHSRIYIYVDGTNSGQSTTTVGTGIHASPVPLSIGARKSARRTSYDSQFIGSISDVAIFTNVLNAAQVLSLYNAARKAPESATAAQNPWRFPGQYEIQCAASGLALTVTGGSKDDGTPIVQWPFDGSAGALWTFIATSNGYCQIKNVNSGKDLGIQGASTSDSAMAVQWPLGTVGNDQWKPVLNSDGTYTFYNLHSSLVLDDLAGSTAKGTVMGQWSVNGTPNQKFIVTRKR
jgi:serine/threonine protein kinase